MVVERVAVRSAGDLSDNRLGPGAIAIGPAGIAYHSPPEQGVPQVGVELDALRLATTGDFDAAEPIVPFVSRLASYAVEVPMIQFRCQVLAGLFNAYVRKAHLHLNDGTCIGGESDQRFAVLARQFFDRSKVLSIRPTGERGQGRIELGGEVDRAGLWAAGGWAVDQVALDAAIADTFSGRLR